MGLVSVCSMSRQPRARTYASHVWPVWSHWIVQRTPLMAAARFAQAPAVVELLLKAEADPNATDMVSGWDRDGVGCHIYSYHME